jgi:HEAT repeat protein
LRAKSTGEGDVVDLRCAAANALGRVGGAEATKLLREAARAADPSVRAVVLEALGVAGSADDAVVEMLRKAALDDESEFCRWTAAMGLARVGRPKAVAALAAAFRKHLDSARTGQDPEAADRRFFGMALGVALRTNPDADAGDLLVRALRSSAAVEDRAALTIACALANVPAARARIVETLPRTPIGPVGSSTCFALGLFGGAAGEKKFLHEALLQSGDPTARREAALALAVLHDHDVVDRLRGLAAAKGADYGRASAALCLGRVGDDADIDFLAGMVADRLTSDGLRACVVRALGRLLDEDEGARLTRVVLDGRYIWRSGRGPGPIVDLAALTD